MARSPDTILGDYPVGYGKPPKNHQFKPGKSGNPKGRAKRTPTAAELLDREAARLVTIKTGNSQRKIPKREAILRRVLDMAMQGDLARARLVLPHLFRPRRRCPRARSCLAYRRRRTRRHANPPRSPNRKGNRTWMTSPCNRRFELRCRPWLGTIFSCSTVWSIP